MAARMVFARKGYPDSTIKDICEEGGVSNGGFFTYFKSKKEPLLVIIEQNLGLFDARVNEVIDKAQDQSFEEGCIALLDVVHAVAIGPGRAMSMHVWSLSMFDQEVAAHTRSSFKKILKSLARLVARHRAADSKSEGVKPVNAARALFSTLIPGYIVQILMIGDMSPKAYLQAHRSIWSD
jgi:AcrR family transcriptional regulator